MSLNVLLKNCYFIPPLSLPLYQPYSPYQIKFPSRFLPFLPTEHLCPLSTQGFFPPISKPFSTFPASVDTPLLYHYIQILRMNSTHLSGSGLPLSIYSSIHLPAISFLFFFFHYFVYIHLSVNPKVFIKPCFQNMSINTPVISIDCK